MAARSSGAEAGADHALRAAIVAEARRWIGTPYRHQASCRGAGADCLGLVRGVWRALYGSEPEPAPPYTPDWAEFADGGEPLIAAATRHLLALPTEHAVAGDLLVFRMRDHGPAKHLGILASPRLAPGRIVHAWSRGAVCETHLTASWLRRIAGAFRFPDRRT